MEHEFWTLSFYLQQEGVNVIRTLQLPKGPIRYFSTPETKSNGSYYDSPATLIFPIGSIGQILSFSSKT